ncbi:hypothetical protein PRZ48_001285 [Zasmidium cellare]|uniref:Uncharacterized protein n=1 Tax=Zasmidium cellare TaxID=395010 RepID=A0ABR0F2B2_ZASCE|nr:hypothetical protein PRZ48_001285 [Zasmidium cellare]
MSARYVPPGRRGKPQDTAGGKPPADDESLVSLEEIREHFWHASQDDLPRFSDSTAGRTLHDSAATPGKLAYLILFHGANPQWEADNVIFTKSSLDLLPSQLADDPSKAPSSDEPNNVDEGSASKATGAEVEDSKVKPDGVNTEVKLEPSSEKPAVDGSSGHKNGPNPIAVFKHARKGQVGRFLRFDGWYQIDRLAFLNPGSPELVKMLEKKWTKTDRFGNARPQERSEEKWKESLSHRWAVLKLRKDKVAEKELGVPKIERLDLDPESPKVARKSVNEMLAEMRMGDQNSGNNASQ